MERRFPRRPSADAAQRWSAVRVAAISFLSLFSSPLFFSFLLLQQKGGASPPHPPHPRCSVFAWACCEVEGALIVLERVCDYGAFRDQSASALMLSVS